MLLFSCSVVSDSLWDHGLQHARLPVLHHLLELAQTHLHWVSDAIQSPHPLSLPSPAAFNLSQLRVFSNESALCVRWPTYWSFSISPSNEYSGLIFFRKWFDWFDLLAFQGTLKNIPQNHNLKTSVLQRSVFFMGQLSHPYMATRWYIAHAQLLSHVWLLVTPWTVAHQVPLSMGFSRQEYWSGLPFPPPGYLPKPGIEPALHL